MKNIRTNLKAGASFDSANEFLTAFMDNITNSETLPFLTTVLMETNEQCKQSGQASGPQCDIWSEMFNLPFARG